MKTWTRVERREADELDGLDVGEEEESISDTSLIEELSVYVPKCATGKRCVSPTSPAV